MSGYPSIPQAPQQLPSGASIRRFTQVSNAANSTSTTANTTIMLPINNDGAFAFNYNNPTGFCSVDTDNDWIDVTSCSQYSDIEARITLRNPSAGNVSGQVVMRLIPDKTNPTVGVVDILSDQITFSTQSAVITTAYKGATQAIRIGVRTTTNNTVELQGVYLKVWDVL